MSVGRIGLRFLAFFMLAALASCVIPGMGLEGTGSTELLPVPRRVTYNLNDLFYPRTDILVYKCKKDGTMVQVPIGTLDNVGIIAAPNEDPDEADDVDTWIDPMGNYLFQRAGRHDVVVSYNNNTMTGRYSVWVEDPLGLDPNPPGGGGDGGGIGIVWN
jgi:hypothetical protein